MTEYRVTLEAYNGPMDLLLYLIRREEVDIHDIPLARITKQYLEYVDLLKKIDPEGVSEFLVLAATLMEIKSRMLLPTPPPEELDEDLSDPRVELVRQLLEYKKFKDAANSLDQSSALQSLKHPRVPVLPPKEEDEVDLGDIDIWDLFNAFNRMLEETGQLDTVHRVGIDDTPIALHAEDVADSLERAGGSQLFEAIFMGRSREEMIGLFLALLELIRQRRIRVTQEESVGAIWIHLLDSSPLDEIEETDGQQQPFASHAETTTLTDPTTPTGSTNSPDPTNPTGPVELVSTREADISDVFPEMSPPEDTTESNHNELNNETNNSENQHEAE